MVIYNEHFLDKDYCQEVIDYFDNINQYKKRVDETRSISQVFIPEDDSPHHWVRDDINSLIKKNLGDNFYLNNWLVVLKYEVGDYFALHHDAGYLRRWSSGGVELNDKSQYKGGDFIFGDEVLDVVPGQLFTHKVDEFHELTEITSGTRYSLHFSIYKEGALI